ncbi:twin-arginine translocation signal domain-containing protein [Candidatus Woesearchaeota archaeon]|nr:twin-arginine translocation signal domain-containing protein [Candidatus Woesearchaeota archaeon]
MTISRRDFLRLTALAGVAKTVGACCDTVEPNYDQNLCPPEDARPGVKYILQYDPTADDCPAPGTEQLEVGCMDNTVIHAPAHYHEAIEAQLEFLLQISDTAQIQQIKAIQFIRMNNECGWGSGFYGRTDGNHVFLQDGMFRDEFWPSELPPPYHGVHPAFPEWGADHVLAHEIGHTLDMIKWCGDNLAYFKRHNLLPDERYGDPDTFTEWLMDRYAHMTENLYYIERDEDESPVFRDFIKPSMERGEVEVATVRRIMGEDLLTIVDESASLHNKQVDFFIGVGALDAALKEDLDQATLSQRLHDLYDRQRQNALDELPATSGFIQQGLVLRPEMPVMRCGTINYQL